MAFKLGEILLRKRIITRKQLEEALEAQVVYGGRLGTNLVELGFINEDTLASVISQQLNIPFVKPERLKNIPDATINILSREIVEKYRVLPLGTDGGVLRLGMSPPDPAAINEISRLTGLNIIPFVVLEVRLREALDHYYGISRDSRLVDTAHRLDSRRTKAAAPGRALPDPGTTIQSARQGLEKAGNREDVADITVESALLVVKRAALFIHKGSYIQGWTGRGEGLTQETVRRMEIPANVPSIFRSVGQDGKTLWGPVPDEAFSVRALAMMGDAHPETIVLSPIPIRGRILIFLYGDNGDGGRISQKERDFIDPLAVEVGRAFERLIFTAHT